MKRHGSYTLTCSKDSMLIKCFGSWNLETTRIYSLEYKAVAAPLINRSWAVVCDMRNWELATPESMTVFQGLMNWCFDMGMKSCIYVYEDSFIKRHYLREMADRIKNEIPEDYNFIHMTDTSHAYDWLKSHDHEVILSDLLELDAATEDFNNQKHAGLGKSPQFIR